MIKNLIAKRRRQFMAQSARYLRYVFNDHFIVALLLLLGFVSVEYSNLLKNFPDNAWPYLVSLIVITGLSLFLGNTATYMLKADKQFLLTKESEIIENVKTAKKRSIIFWSVIQLFICLLFAPLLLAMEWPIWAVVAYPVVTLILRYLVMTKKTLSLILDNRLNWDEAINYESRREQSILKFFSLFTSVKGIISAVKPRRYLNRILKRSKQQHDLTWYNLYLRAFFRAGDYFMLTVRLVILALACLLFVQNVYFAIALAVLLNYMLLFQLTGLYHHYDYQYLTQLYPIGEGQKGNNLKRLLRQLAYGIAVLEVVLYLPHLEGIIILVATVLLMEVLIARKINKFVD